MDEAFIPFHQLVENMTSIEGEMYDEKMGVRSYIFEFEIDTPVELDILTDEDGIVQIGTVPPLYRVETSFRPSYHRIKFNAEITAGSK